MTLKDKIKKTLTGLAIVGSLALPQGLDYVINGPYKATQIGDGLTRRVIHEYNDKIVVTGWAHPWGSVMVDNNKDGNLDEYWFRSVPSRVIFNIKIDSLNMLFQARQEEYEKLQVEYEKLREK